MPRTRRGSCPPPTATSTSSTASSSTWPARSTTAASAALLDGLLADAELRAAWRRAPCSRGGHHAYLGGLLEHTVAVATLAYEVCQLHPRLNSDLLLTAAITHDLGRTREFTYGAEIGLTDEGRLLGHLVIGERMISERAGRARRGAPAGAAALRALPPRAVDRARRPVRHRRGAGAVPAQRARRIGQGRLRARTLTRLVPSARDRRTITGGAARAWWPIQSSKLAGPGSPRLGRFDSFAASCVAGAQFAPK